MKSLRRVGLGQTVRSVGAELEAFCRGIWREALERSHQEMCPHGNPVWSKTRNVRHKLVDSSSFSAHMYW